LTLENLLDIHDVLSYESRKLMYAKNSDYNANDDPLGNLRACECIGVAGERGVLIRMLDKIKRLDTIASGKELKVGDEKLKDTILDIINYSVLFYAMVGGSIVNADNSQN
jgi:hypothetical protein